MNTNGKSTNGRATADEPNVAASFSGFAHDAIELAELQAQLLLLDVKTATQQARMSLVLSIVGVGLLLGCIPVALFALAEFFVIRLEWSRPAALGAAAALGLAISAAISATAWFRLRVGLESLQRSRDELNRNLAWIKSNLKRARLS